ncbi:MAG: SDR family oxidoreductase [Oligoflexia bacterium]|nr:SDR family oxidoreductase [Oligoflexia bacterium]
MDNKHKVALVTGASSGIGEAISSELISIGWTVVGVARSKDKLLKIESESKGLFLPLVCDLSQSDDITKISHQLIDKGICPKLFFLNAAIAGEKCIEDPNHFKLKIHEEIMRVNYFGVLAWVEFWENHCKQNGGANFIVTSSVNAIFASPTVAAMTGHKDIKMVQHYATLSADKFQTEASEKLADFMLKLNQSGDGSANANGESRGESEDIREAKLNAGT